MSLAAMLVFDDSETELPMMEVAFDLPKMYWSQIDCWPLYLLNFRHIHLSLGIHYN
jgi:hypothetical protein